MVNLLCAIVAAVATAHLVSAAPQGGNFKVDNGVLAQQLDNAKATAKNGDACSNDTCCGLFVCLCTGGQLQQTVSCGAALPCQVLPLVNRPGVSPTCTSDADKTARIQAALGSGGGAAPAAPAAPAPAPPAAPKQAGKNNNNNNNNNGGGGGSGVSDAQRISFLTANAGALNNAAVVPLNAPEVLPPVRTRTAEAGCAEIGNGFVCVDLARNARCLGGRVANNDVNPFSGSILLKACVGGFCGGGASANPCTGTAAQAVAGMNEGREFFLPPSGAGGAAASAPKQVAAPKQAPAPAPAAPAPAAPAPAPVASTGNFKVDNGVLAQQLDNAKATAKNGDACSNDTCCGLFVCLCTGGQLQQTVSCGAALPCQVLPLVNRPGVSPTCTSDADKTARIQAALGSGGGAAPAAPAAPAPAPPAAPKQAGKNNNNNNNNGGGGGAVSDAQRISFLKSFRKISDFNTNAIVPINAAEMTVPRRRTAEEGCAEVGNGFICFDLARNIRCEGGRVAKNFVKPFDANTNLKACIFDIQRDLPGFCGGGVGANQCVSSAEQAVAGLRAGNEFFLAPALTGEETA
ncbi:hypothetical protein HDU67_008929 [Dinochytrium kinnereticum]|nr:hypothetical protein HDU67_008929 [Dinochytrium kinnereticum]